MALTGGSISQIVMPQIISILQRTLGHNATILTLGAVTLNGGVMAQLYHPLCEHGVRRKETEESSEQLKPLAGEDKTYKKRKGTKIMFVWALLSASLLIKMRNKFAYMSSLV